MTARRPYELDNTAVTLTHRVIVDRNDMPDAGSAELQAIQTLLFADGSVAWSNITGKPLTFPPDAHAHNDLYYTEIEIDALLAVYYTETEVDTLLADKSDIAHVHGINDLTDVDTVTVPPASGQALVWDGLQWEPATIASGVHDHDSVYYTETETDALLAGKADTAHVHGIDDLTDVDTATVPPTSGQALVWDGVQWEPATVATGVHDHDAVYYTEIETDALLAGKSDTAHVHDIDDLTDVDTSTTAPVSGQALVWDGVGGVWKGGSIEPPAIQINVPFEIKESGDSPIRYSFRNVHPNLYYRFFWDNGGGLAYWTWDITYNGTSLASGTTPTGNSGQFVIEGSVAMTGLTVGNWYECVVTITSFDGAAGTYFRLMQLYEIQ